jgi:sugar lactone lactonase YvrE
LTEQGIAIDLRDRNDFPDGMVDAGDGTVIVAFFNPHRGGDGEAVHYRLDTGEAIGRWSVHGSPRVTCPLLVSMNGQVKLILTTADEAMPPEIRSASPNAGCLFIAETTIPRLPPAAICSL